MEEHIRFLKKSAFYLSKNINELTLPSLFEYYSAFYLSKKLNIQFYVWKDLTPTQKELCEFPNTYNECNIVDGNFNHLCQAKYHENNITFPKLATLFCCEKFSKKQYQFHLLRSEKSKISRDVEHIIKIGNLDDNILLEMGFQKFIRDCKNFEDA